ncbi:hypothetical protein [Croceimicrobium hydrocarbonivorans]|uniref:Secretion system C-terminal sorting domain-containing protein n=1 Tax=Croceimicrobium hydrocarbonivorans TaxID=2761580 RepID=A0A7H0VBX9_9FLAO|nr:hypothetical protein [Croceimicrobium hydrocarbonivorans]QNR23227.1 hypothetical protein H4K34_12685 [Croceimicrobium hydrocarbonivorans]
MKWPGILSKFLVLLGILCLSGQVTAQHRGSLDPSFGKAGISQLTLGSLSEQAHDVVYLADGSLLVAATVQASFTTAQFALLKLKPNGALDSSFATNGRVITAIEDRSVPASMALQPDGNIVVAGASRWFVNIVRYLANGELDTSFADQGKLIHDYPGYYSERCLKVLIQNDGKILCLGHASHFSNDKPFFTLSRYLPNGQIDSAFGSDGVVIGLSGRAYTGLLQQDAKILIAGVVDGEFAAMRFDSNGSLDSSFGSQGSVQIAIGNFAEVRASAQQADGKLIFAGASDSLVTLIRCHPDGSLDQSFGQSGISQPAVGKVQDIKLRADGSMYLAGGSRPHTGQGHFQLIHLLGDGSLNFNFAQGGILQSPMGIYSLANSLAIQADGKVVLAGARYDSSGQGLVLSRYYGQPWISLPTYAEPSTIEVFPNPIKDFAWIRMKGEPNQQSLSLYNTQDQCMRTFKITGQELFRLDRNSLPAGVYVLKSEGVAVSLVLE